jgi:hypothetical protein
VTKCLKQPPVLPPPLPRFSPPLHTHPPPSSLLCSSLLSKKNQLASNPYPRHVRVAGVLQASAAGVLAADAPPARGRGGRQRRRRDHVAGGSGLPLPDADGRREPGEAAGDVPAGAAEAAGARGVPEAPVRGRSAQPAAGGAGAALLAPAPRASAAAARPEEEAPEGGLHGAQQEEHLDS